MNITKINKNEETGYVTYTWEDGSAVSIPTKNAKAELACDGDVVPFKWDGRHYLYMYYKNLGKHYWRCLENDIVYDKPPTNSYFTNENE